jgi:hypothetical protein
MVTYGMEGLLSAFLLDPEHVPEGALACFVKPGKGRPVTLAYIIAVIWDVPSLA